MSSFIPATPLLGIAPERRRPLLLLLQLGWRSVPEPIKGGPLTGTWGEKEGGGERVRANRGVLLWRLPWASRWQTLARTNKP